MRRIESGADIEMGKQFTGPIKTIIEDVNIDKLAGITGVYDAANRRIIWYYPLAESLVNNAAIVYQLDTKTFTRYTGGSIKTAFANQRYAIFALTNDSELCPIGVGTQDITTPYTATYKSAWFDTGGWDNKKRLQYLDVVVDSTTDYEINVTYRWDYGTGPTETVVISKSGSTVLTNGMVVDASRKGPNVNIHRLFTKGNGVAWQLQIEGTGYMRVLGWKPEYLVLGGRN
jgi:hypothetical protein